MTVAAILAGGSGTRMGSAIPKQFIEIEGMPVIMRSIKAFVQNPNTDICVVSVGSQYIDYTKRLISDFFGDGQNIFVIEGGKTRGGTLRGVLDFLKEKNMLENTVILTHDAVRPFITDRIINENIEAAEKYGACNTCVPAVDTVLLSEDGEFISSVPSRAQVFHAQTPQSFNACKLYSLINKTPEDVFEALTDGCSVFTLHGEKVHIVRGESYNIKITYPDDIIRAKGIIEQYFN